MKLKTWFVYFFKCSLNFRACALQSELNRRNIFNFIKFQALLSAPKPNSQDFVQPTAK